MPASTATKSLVKQARTLLHENLQEYFLETTTTGAGSTTTLVITSSIANDYFNNNAMEVLIVSGSNVGLRADIVDWVQSTGVITVADDDAFPFTVATAVSIQIGQKGFFSDQDFEPWFNDGADAVFRAINPEKLVEYQEVNEQVGSPVSGQNYGTAPLPSDYLHVPSAVWIDNRISAPLAADETEVFETGAMIDRCWLVEDQDNIKFKPKPETTATVKYRYIPRPATFYVSATLTVDWPLLTIAPIIRYVVAQGYFKRERVDLYQVAIAEMVKLVDVINARS